MSGYVAMNSYADRVAVLNDIQSIITLMRTWNNDSQRVEQYVSSEGLTDSTVALNVGNALRGMGPGTDLTTSNEFNQFIKSNLDGNYNTADHKYWLPADTSRPYSRGLSWLHTYPNPVKIKIRETECFYFSPGNKANSVIYNLFFSDTSPMAGSTGVTMYPYTRGTTLGGATGTGDAIRYGTPIKQLDPYFADGSTQWNEGSNWAYDATAHTFVATAATTSDYLTGGMGTTPIVGARRYDVLIKVDEVTSGSIKLFIGAAEMQHRNATALTIDAAGWYWAHGTASDTTQVEVRPATTFTGVISELKVFDSTGTSLAYAHSTIGWADETLGGNYDVYRTTRSNCTFIAARKQIAQNVTNQFNQLQAQVSMYGYPFSDFKEDTAYATDTPNWDGDIIEIVNGPPNCNKWALVREVLWDPVSCRRGCAMRVQQLYDAGGSAIALEQLSYPITVAEPQVYTAADPYYNNPGAQIFRRFTYVRS